MTDRQRKFREQYMGKVSPLYNGLLHISVMYAAGIAGLWYCASQLSGVTWEWLIAIPVFLNQRASAAKAPAPSASMRLHRNIQLDPEAWLGVIIRLEEQGRHQEAIENLRLFRRKYPDHDLPDVLRKLDP